MYKATLLLDSTSPLGHRAATFEIEFPRIVLAETVTHRRNSDWWLVDEDVFADRSATPWVSKNSASSRAIPLAKMIKKVVDDPYVPERFSVNGKGMQASSFVAEGEPGYDAARVQWLGGRDDMIVRALNLSDDATKEVVFSTVPYVFEYLKSRVLCGLMPWGLHKQEVNRLIEPWAWVKQVVTSSLWPNFFALRCDAAAHPAFQKIARMMYLLYRVSTPDELGWGEWHLPYVTTVERVEALQTRGASEANEFLRDTSAARCAWTSYWPPDGVESTQEKVDRTVAKLKTSWPIHASPFEHQLSPAVEEEQFDQRVCGNMVGWLQYRKMIATEAAKEYTPSDEELRSWYNAQPTPNMKV